MRGRLKILLDENLGTWVYEHLKEKGYNVQSVFIEIRGATDEQVIGRAIEYNKIIITMDKDFGYLAQAYPLPGLILLRLRVPTPENRLEAILRALALEERLYNYITVVTDTYIRRRPLRIET